MLLVRTARLGLCFRYGLRSNDGLYFVIRVVQLALVWGLPLLTCAVREDQRERGERRADREECKTLKTVGSSSAGQEGAPP